VILEEVVDIPPTQNIKKKSGRIPPQINLVLGRAGHGPVLGKVVPLTMAKHRTKNHSAHGVGGRPMGRCESRRPFHHLFEARAGAFFGSWSLQIRIQGQQKGPEFKRNYSPSIWSGEPHGRAGKKEDSDYIEMFPKPLFNRSGCKGRGGGFCFSPGGN